MQKDIIEISETEKIYRKTRSIEYRKKKYQKQRKYGERHIRNIEYRKKIYQKHRI